MIKMRNEKESDYKVVKDITRKAFYNPHVPECGEYCLVHTMHGYEDFIPELDLVLELDGRIIGDTVYTKARLADESGAERGVPTFGPVFVAPECQRRSCGKMLTEYSFKRAVSLGYDVIAIFERLASYVNNGFKSYRKSDIYLEDGSLPAAVMVRELVPDTLDGRRWIYRDSPVMTISEEGTCLHDDNLERMEEEHPPSQEGFYIMSRSFIK